MTHQALTITPEATASLTTAVFFSSRSLTISPLFHCATDLQDYKGFKYHPPHLLLVCHFLLPVCLNCQPLWEERGWKKQKRGAKRTVRREKDGKDERGQEEMGKKAKEVWGEEERKEKGEMRGKERIEWKGEEWEGKNRTLDGKG